MKLPILGLVLGITTAIPCDFEETQKNQYERNKENDSSQKNFFDSFITGLGIGAVHGVANRGISAVTNALIDRDNNLRWEKDNFKANMIFAEEICTLLSFKTAIAPHMRHHNERGMHLGLAVGQTLAESLSITKNKETDLLQPEFHFRLNLTTAFVLLREFIEYTERFVNLLAGDHSEKNDAPEQTIIQEQSVTDEIQAITAELN